MSLFLNLFSPLLNWSVQRKMVFILTLLMVILPLSVLLVLDSKGPAETTNLLVGLVTVAVVLVVPFSKLLSHVVALNCINDLNEQCRMLKQGNYEPTEKLPDGVAGHDFIALKRNMHWMGYTIAVRENKLEKAMTDLTAAKHQIEESIEYASLIQTAFLNGARKLEEVIPNHFLLWEQRDSVGGDSYWCRPWGSGYFIGVIDCTGHGVPGAFMTLIVQSLLERSATVTSSSPAGVLESMNIQIKDALGQHCKSSHSDDGMDCALCYVEPERRKLVFAGANLPLYVVDGKGTRLIKGDRCGVGYVRSPGDYKFTDHELDVEQGMRFYLATDGITDQVGGSKGFPFGKKRLMRFMGDNLKTAITEQADCLGKVLSEYQGMEARRDDVTVLGFELS